MSEWIVPWAVCHVCCTLILSDCPCLSDHLYGPVRRPAGWRFHEVRPAPVCSSACMFLAHWGSAAPPLPRLHCFVPLCCLLSPLFSALHGCQSPAVASIGVSGPHVSLFVNFSIEFPGCIILLFIEERQSTPLHWTFQTNHVITWFLLGIYWKLVSHC